MRIICIECSFNYRLWQSEVIAISNYDAKELERLAAEIIKGIRKTVVLYTSMSMEFAYEGFLGKIKGAAVLVPVGGSAAVLGLGNAEPEHISEINRYITFGRDANIIELEKYLVCVFGDGSAGIPKLPKQTAFYGIFGFNSDVVYASLEDYLDVSGLQFARYVAIYTHRHAWVNGNLAAIKALSEELMSHGVGAIPVFSSTDKNSPDFAELSELCFYKGGKVFIQGLVIMSMFAVMARGGRTVSEQSIMEFKRLGIPVFSPVQSYYQNESGWRSSNNPLAEDMPSSLIIPETQGMIEPIIISIQGRDGMAEPLFERVRLAARRISSWVQLRVKENTEKKVALMLHNAVCSGVEATIGRAFGLDAMESAVRILCRLTAEGYHITDIPKNGAALLELFMSKKAFSDFRWTSVEDIVEAGGCIYKMPVNGEYDRYFAQLPQANREYMERVWGEPPGEGMVVGDSLVITGLVFGNVLMMIQPKRGCYGAKCTGEVCKILHDPACPPPHQYLAAYRYLRDVFEADAIIDIGTDGSAEYLPGKVSGLSETCWPSIVSDSMPSLYAYNVGAVSESMLAKRRLNSVITDYLTPASMGVDEKATELSRLIDEYQNATQLGSSQVGLLREKIMLLLDEVPAAKRIIGNGDIGSALSDVREAIRRADIARYISAEPHIFGQNPSNEEIRRFVREVWQSENVVNSVPLEGQDFEELERGLLSTGLEMDNLILGLNGGYIPAGESGMPDENGRNIIPTGRNMFGMQIDKVPAKAAWSRGVELAEQLLGQYLKDEGRLPEQIAMNMISLDVTRSGGEQLSQFLHLLGIRPVWDKQGRVTGLEVIPPEELGRPRIDVTVRISGVLRDTWPSVVVMMDEAVLIAANLGEDEEQNYISKHIREYRTEFDIEPDEEKRAVRIFGDPPGAYGSGINLALLASAWKNEDDLIKYFTQSSAFAYGKGLDGERKVREFVDIAKKVELSTDITQSRRMNALACGFGVQVQGGYRLLAKKLGRREIRQYQSISEAGSAPVTQALDESIRRTAEDTILNEFWIESAKTRGYDGAADIMHSMQNVFSAQVVTDSFSDEFLDRITEKTINDEEMREWLEYANPHALEEIGRRLLELESRGKWKPDEDVLHRLRQNYLIIEGDMEGRLEPLGEIQGGNVDIINHEGVALWETQLRDIESALRE